MVIIRLTIPRKSGARKWGRRLLDSPRPKLPADRGLIFDKSIFDGDVDIADVQTFRR